MEYNNDTKARALWSAYTDGMAENGVLMFVYGIAKKSVELRRAKGVTQDDAAQTLSVLNKTVFKVKFHNEKAGSARTHPPAYCIFGFL